MYAASLATIDCVEYIVKEEAIDCDFARCGHLEVACKQKHFDDYSRQCRSDRLRLPSRAARRATPRTRGRDRIKPSTTAAWSTEASAGLNPRVTSTDSHTPATKAGAELFRAHPRGEDRNAIRGTVKWDGRSQPPAGRFGARSIRRHQRLHRRATPALQKKIIPIGSFIITTEILPEKLAANSAAQPHDLRLEKLSLLLSSHARWPHAGSEAVPHFSRRTTRPCGRSAGILRRGMIDVYPQLADARIGLRLGGTSTSPSISCPRRPARRLYYALGSADHGVAMATYQGQKIAG